MIEVRFLLEITVCSGVVAVLAVSLFRTSPATRRLLIEMLAMLLVAAPVVSAVAGLRVPVGIDQPPTWVEAPMLPLLPLMLLAGSGCLWALLHVAGAFRERCRLGRLPRLRDRALEETAAQNLKALGSSRKVRFRIGAEPCSTTIGPALVVLPVRWSGWSEPTRRAVIAHEMVHVARHDARWMLALECLSRVLWWLPWLRTLPVAYERAVEESCDDLATVLVGHELTYLDGVFAAALDQQTAGGRCAAALMGSSLLRRVRRFAARRDQSVDSCGLFWMGVLCAAGFALVSSVVMVRLPEQPAEGLRVVAVTTPESTDNRIELRLRDKPRPPLHANVDPPMR